MYQASQIYQSGLGDNAVHVRLLVGGGFWDFAVKASSPTETANCKIYLKELPTSSGQSWYYGSLKVPAGGPYSVEFVLDATGEVIGNDLVSADVEPVVPPAPPFNPPRVVFQPVSSLAPVVSICNMALGRIGVSLFIQDINERSLESAVCKQFYDTARDRCLEAFPWNFADSYVELQDIGSPPIGWGYRYRYPTNCVKALNVLADAYTRDPIYGRAVPATRFVVIADEAAGGKTIVCNLKSAVLRYTARITNPSIFSAEFIDALAWLLAAEIASPLAKPEYGRDALTAYSAAILRAGAGNMNEGNMGNVMQNQETDFLRARR